jgi:hypothetical protein
MGSADDDPTIYEAHTFVRARRRGNSWVSWNHRLGGGPVLTVRNRSLEVSAPQGMSLESRDIVIKSGEATMWFDKVGWAGTPFARKECIHVAGRDQRGRRVELEQ